MTMQPVRDIDREYAPAILSPEALKIGRPVMVDPAFDDPEVMIDLIDRNAPYQQTEARLTKPTKARLEPWFRGTLAANEEPMVEGVEPCFHNPNFISAARQSFHAEIVRPLSLTINLHAPMVSGKKHTDLPFFRGATDRRLGGVRYAMGASGLFRRWEITVASAIAWFHQGEGGSLDIWPDGPDAPYMKIRAPMWNLAVVSDNERMFHRVHATGKPEDYMPDGASAPDMTLCRSAEGWEIRNTRTGTFGYSPSQIRTSILWKAFVFENEAAERAYDMHDDDLTEAMIVDILRADLADRGLSSKAPAELTDPEWIRVLADQYPSSYFN